MDGDAVRRSSHARRWNREMFPRVYALNRPGVLFFLRCPSGAASRAAVHLPAVAARAHAVLFVSGSISQEPNAWRTRFVHQHKCRRRREYGEANAIPSHTAPTPTFALALAKSSCCRRIASSSVISPAPACFRFRFVARRSSTDSRVAASSAFTGSMSELSPSSSSASSTWAGDILPAPLPWHARTFARARAHGEAGSAWALAHTLGTHAK